MAPSLSNPTPMSRSKELELDKLIRKLKSLSIHVNYESTPEYKTTMSKIKALTSNEVNWEAEIEKVMESNALSISEKLAKIRELQEAASSDARSDLYRYKSNLPIAEKYALAISIGGVDRRKKKPLIVSMGDVAASGGYYIASYGDSVFAQPSTITGSIGVFSMMFNIEKLLTDKLRVTLDAEKNAPMADFPNATRQFTDKERAIMQQSVDQIYSIFKTRVATGRKIPMQLVDSIAQGRVWTGVDALRLHLIDAYGDLDRALASAAAMAHVKDYRVVNYPAPVDKFELFLQKFKGANASAIAKSYMQEQMSTEFIWLKKIQQLKQIQGKAQMLMPFQLTIQ